MSIIKVFEEGSMEKETYRSLRFEDKYKLIQIEYGMYQHVTSILGKIYALIENAPTHDDYDENVFQNALHQLDSNLKMEPYFVNEEGTVFSIVYTIPKEKAEISAHRIHDGNTKDISQDEMIVVRPMTDFAVAGMIVVEDEKVLVGPSLAFLDKLVGMYHRIASNFEEFMEWVKEFNEAIASQEVGPYAKSYPVADMMSVEFWDQNTPDVIKQYFMEVLPESTSK